MSSKAWATLGGAVVLAVSSIIFVHHSQASEREVCDIYVRIGISIVSVLAYDTHYELPLSPSLLLLLLHFLLYPLLIRECTKVYYVI